VKKRRERKKKALEEEMREGVGRKGKGIGPNRAKKGQMTQLGLATKLN
jgi:hypothetical protein